MIEIYQYFTEPSSPISSASSKKSSSANSNSTAKKSLNISPTTTDEGTTTNPKDQQYQEALRDLKISWIPK